MQDAGIKLEVKNEKEFRSAITNINTATKTFRTELDALTSSFDKNDSAMAKTKAKREALTSAISDQKQKIEQLKSAMDQMNQSGNVSETTMLRARQALANATSELNRMEDELRNLPNDVQLLGQKWQEVGEKIQSVGEKVSSIGDTLTTHVTGPILALGTAAVASFKSLDSGYDTIIKKTGATGDALADLKTQANDIFSTMNVTMDQVGAAVGEVNTRFGLAGEAAEAAARAFLEFAQVNGVEVSGAIDGVQIALSAFNMGVDESQAMLDALTAASQQYGVEVSTLTQGLTTNATAFQEMGLSAYQAIDFMGQLEIAGADSNLVLQGMKKALKEATDQGVPFDQALAQLENTIVNGTSDMDGLSAAYDLFGKSGAAVYQAVKNGQISFTEFAATTDILNGSLGATASTYEATLDPIDKFQIALNNAKLAGADLGSSLLSMLTPVIEKLTGIIQKVSEWWGNLTEKQQQHIISIAAVVAAVGPLLSVGGRIISGIGTVVSGVGSLGTALGALGGILPALGTAFATVGSVMMGTVLPAIVSIMTALTPVMPYIIAIGAAITAIILIIKNWGAIVDWIKGVWENVKNAISNVLGGIKEGISNAWNNIKEKTKEAFNHVKETVSNAWNNIKSGIGNALGAVKDKVSNVWGALKQSTSECWSNIKAKVQEHGGGIKGIIAGAVEAYKSYWKIGFDTINSITGGRLGEALETVKSKLSAIKQAFTDKLNAAKDFVKGVIDKIKSFFKFEWSLPKLKMPHLSITGSFSLSPPSVPHFSIEWYKKAYNNPVMFSSPTVLGTSGGLKGFGDGSGGEIVIGRDMMYSFIRDAMAEGAAGGTYNNDVNITINTLPGQDAEEIAELVSQKINEAVYARRAVYA